MTLDMPITFTDIQNAYASLAHYLQEALKAQTRLNELEAKKADIWAQLTSNPDFKPGNSNLQRDAKMRAAAPQLMAEYDAQYVLTEDLKLKSQLASSEIGRLKDTLALGKILTAIKDD